MDLLPAPRFSTGILARPNKTIGMGSASAGRHMMTVGNRRDDQP